jgi:hypothetical protein
MLQNAVSRLRKPLMEPSESAALIAHLNEKEREGSVFFYHTEDNALTRLFVQHRPMNEFFNRYYHFLSFDTTRKVTRYECLFNFFASMLNVIFDAPM